MRSEYVKIERGQQDGMHDRAHVDVDGKYDVVVIRADEGIVIDVYPEGWDSPLDTFTVWDDDVLDEEVAS